MTDGRNCKTCLWAVAATAPDRAMITECRRNPPVVSAVGTPHGIAQMTSFPRVNADWYCGDFAAKPAVLAS